MFKKITTPFPNSLILLGGLVIFFLDQALKHKIYSMGGFYVCNKGVSFGLLLSGPLFGLLLFFWVIFLYIYLKGEIKISKSVFISLGLLFGGIFSNLSDRVLFDCVFDYIIIDFWKGFPVFNIADIAISAGGLLMLITIFKNKGG